MAKILFVDDEPDMELLIRKRLSRRVRAGEIELVFAQNGVQALQRLAEMPDIDLILSDINMPEMDGLSLLGEIGRKRPDLKAVMVTAYGDLANIRTAMNRGAFDFLTKPIDFQDLEVTVQRALEHLKNLRESVATRDKLLALGRELDVARRMQASILPSQPLIRLDFEIAGQMVPANEVGGDFFDFFPIDERRYGLVIADVSGKGIPAALFMMVSRKLLKATALEEKAPGACLTHLNEMLVEENEEAMFVTAFHGILDTVTGDLVYANAGHAPPFLAHADGTVSALESSGGMVLGIAPGLTFVERTIRLAPGDTLCLFTDGVTEDVNPAGEEFGEERLAQILTAASKQAADKIGEGVVQAVGAFAAEAPQADDITCLALRYKGANAGTQLNVSIRNQLAEIPPLALQIEQFGALHGIARETLADLNLALDELITNIVSYGFPAGGEHEIKLRLRLQDARLIGELTDDGIAFDPLSKAKPASLDQPIENRPIGGLGIHFVRTLMDSVEYRRDGDRNRLVLIRRLEGGRPQDAIASARVE